ncbi:MAG: protein-disulfide reductase DsbD domain-containing protein [Bryobacteraceae bacterium]
MATFLCLPSLWAQGNQYLMAEAPQKLVAKRGTSVEAKIAVSIEPNFHVNSNTPSDAYLIPLKLTWTAGGALEPGEVVFPKARMEKYEFSDKPLSVYSGDFDLVAKFKVPAGAPQGPGIMVGKLRYQACNNNSCFPPKTAEVRLSYSVQ